MELKDKIALVTGGSRGLGRSIAMHLSNRGAITVICGRNEEDLVATSESIDGCSYVVADVSSVSDVERMFLTVKRRYGRIDLLVNNAGVGVCGPFLEVSEDDLDLVINVNLKGAFFCAQEGARAMRDQGEGCIVNILSGAAEVGLENLSVYCASKHALSGLTKSMKVELDHLGIRVVAVSPGYIKTGFFDSFPQGYEIPQDAPSPDVVAEGIVKLLERWPARRGVREVMRSAKRRLLN